MSSPAAPFTVRSTADLIALVPVVIGFEPEESLTLLSFAANPPGRPFHARVDLPPVDGGCPDGRPDREALEQVVRSISEPVSRQRVTQAALLVHSARPRLAAETAGPMAEALAGPRSPRVRLLDSVRVHDGRWFRLPGPHVAWEPTPADGVPFDVALHPFRLHSVVSGRVLHASREALAATLEPDRAAVARVAAQSSRTPTAGVAEAEWARRTVAASAASGRPLDDGGAARLLTGMRDLRVRDAAWSTMTRADAPAHAELWRDLVRRSPDALLPAPGSLLAFAAWLAGEGALAWCALDRVRAVEPGYSLAGLVAGALEHACDPRVWSPGDLGMPDTPPEGAVGATGAVRPSPRGPECG